MKIENLLKKKAASCLHFRRQSCWATSISFMASVFKTYPFKVTIFVKIQTFRQLPNSRKRLRSACHSIGEINIFLIYIQG